MTKGLGTGMEGLGHRHAKERIKLGSLVEGWGKREGNGAKVTEINLTTSKERLG
jgi:hypothetical protein